MSFNDLVISLFSLSLPSDCKIVSKNLSLLGELSKNKNVSSMASIMFLIKGIWQALAIYVAIAVCI